MWHQRKKSDIRGGRVTSEEEEWHHRRKSDIRGRRVALEEEEWHQKVTLVHCAFLLSNLP